MPEAQLNGGNRRPRPAAQRSDLKVGSRLCAAAKIPAANSGWQDLRSLTCDEGQTATSPAGGERHLPTHLRPPSHRFRRYVSSTTSRTGNVDPDGRLCIAPLSSPRYLPAKALNDPTDVSKTRARRPCASSGFHLPPIRQSPMVRTVVPACGLKVLSRNERPRLRASLWFSVTSLCQPPAHSTGMARPRAHDARPCSMISVWRPLEKVVPDCPIAGRVCSVHRDAYRVSRRDRWRNA